MAPKKANPKADEAAKAALLAARKGKALALTQSTHQEATEDDVLCTCEDDPLRTCGPEGQSQPPPGFAPLEGANLTEDDEVLGVSAKEQLQLRALRLKNRNLQRQKEILEAKRQRVSALAKVRQMIRDEEQKAQDLEREIALMQREGHLGLQHGPPPQQQLEDTREGHLSLQYGPPLQQRAQPQDPRFPQRDHTFPHAAPFQGVNYLDERSPLAPHLQVTPWPANFRAGTVGAKAKTPPFARGLRLSRWSDRDKSGRDPLRSIRHFDEGLRRRLPAARPRSVLRPTCDLAHCNGPCVAAFVLRA
jgi:hypothetical protein